MQVRTYTGDILAYVWLVFGIATLLMVFILGSNHQYALINPVLLVSYGVPTFTSGIILRFRSLMWGGMACWILAVVSSMVLNDFQLVIIALAVLIAWIIPGYQLRNKFKQSNS